MRTPLLILLLLIPASAIAYHYGPGQSQLALDRASVQLRLAEEHVRRERFASAVAAFDAALSHIPSDRVDLTRSITLERAKARLESHGLSEAYDELTALKEEVDAAGASVSPAFAADLRGTLAQAEYYMTWLMRLEGEPRENWEPDIEAARQNYKLLADAARTAGDDSRATRFEGDLEAAIRLARLDLSELQALPLPKQCQSCCSGKCQCKRNGKCKGKGKGDQKPKPEDIRKAGSGPPPDEKGS